MATTDSMVIIVHGVVRQDLMRVGIPNTQECILESVSNFSNQTLNENNAHQLHGGHEPSATPLLLLNLNYEIV